MGPSARRMSGWPWILAMMVMNLLTPPCCSPSKSPNPSSRNSKGKMHQDPNVGKKYEMESGRRRRSFAVLFLPLPRGRWKAYSFFWVSHGLIHSCQLCRTHPSVHTGGRDPGAACTSKSPLMPCACTATWISQNSVLVYLDKSAKGSWALPGQR